MCSKEPMVTGGMETSVRHSVYWLLVIFVSTCLLTISVSGQKGQNPYTEETCFHFPASDTWINPTNVTLNLRCPQGQAIQVLGADYIRPMVRGDMCTTEAGCQGGTCCCRQWEINCTIPVSYYTTHYSHLTLSCENQTQCEVVLASQPLDGKCKVSDCDSGGQSQRFQRCWARLVRVTYNCTSEVSSVSDTGASVNIIILAVVGSVVVMVILIILIIVICIRKRKLSCRSWSKTPKPYSFLEVQNTDNHSRDSHRGNTHTDHSANTHNDHTFMLRNADVIRTPPDSREKSPVPMPEYAKPGGSCKPSGKNDELAEDPDCHNYQDIEEGVGSDVELVDNAYYESTEEDTSKYKKTDINSNAPCDESNDNDKISNAPCDESHVSDEKSDDHVYDLYECLADCQSAKADHNVPSKAPDSKAMLISTVSELSDVKRPCDNNAESAPYAYTYEHFETEGRKRQPYVKHQTKD